MHDMFVITSLEALHIDIHFKCLRYCLCMIFICGVIMLEIPILFKIYIN